MNSKIVYCKKCLENPINFIQHMQNVTNFSEEEVRQYFVIGHFNISDEKRYCSYHPNEEFITLSITDEEYNSLCQISTEPSFIQAMNDLKEKDPIEYNLKLSQFKAQLAQQESVSSANQIKCPKCGSTSIATGARGVNNFWGLLGASKTVNRCAKCGHTWKPRG